MILAGPDLGGRPGGSGAGTGTPAPVEPRVPEQPATGKRVDDGGATAGAIGPATEEP